ncbi:unknown [Akkermansia sp. CAG:344]|nr:unknown [Akkermansia sp. CAG:344]
MKGQQVQGGLAQLLLLWWLRFGNQLGVPGVGIIAAQLAGLVKQGLEQVAVHGSPFLLHAAGEVAQQGFQISPGAQFRQKLSGLLRGSTLRHLRQQAHGCRVSLLRGLGKGLDGHVPPLPAVRIVAGGPPAQGKGQFPHPGQKNRFGVFPVLLQGLKHLAGVFLQPVHPDKGKLGKRVLVAGGGFLFQRGEVALQLGFRQVRNGVQRRDGVQVSLLGQLAAGVQPFRVLRLHGLRLENPENPVGVRHHELGSRMTGFGGRFTEEMLHVLQAGQRQVPPVQVIKPHPVLPGQHVGPEVSRGSLAEQFPVRPAAVHGQLGKVPDRDLLHLHGWICPCLGRNVLGMNRNGKNKGNKQKTGTHGSTLF